MYTVTEKHVTATVQSFDDINKLAHDERVCVSYHAIAFAIDKQRLFLIESKLDKGLDREGGAGNKLMYVIYGKYREHAARTGHAVPVDQDRYDLLKSLFAKGVLVTIRIFIA